MVSPILRRKLILPKPPPKAVENKPFLVDRTTGQQQDSLRDQALSSTVPVNQELLKQAAKYRDKSLPALLQDPIRETRQFFLKELAPIALAVSNGLLEAQEILKEVFEEEPDTGPYTRRIEELTYQAMEVKMISFVERLLSLTPEETKRFLITVYAKDLKSDDLVSVLSRLTAKEAPPLPEDRKRKKGRR